MSEFVNGNYTSAKSKANIEKYHEHIRSITKLIKRVFNQVSAQFKLVCLSRLTYK